MDMDLQSLAQALQDERAVNSAFRNDVLQKLEQIMALLNSQQASSSRPRPAPLAVNGTASHKPPISPSPANRSRPSSARTSLSSVSSPAKPAAAAAAAAAPRPASASPAGAGAKPQSAKEKRDAMEEKKAADMKAKLQAREEAAAQQKAILDEKKQVAIAERQAAGTAKATAVHERKAQKESAENGRVIDWTAVFAKLPVGTSEEDRKLRSELWKQFDVNGNNVLSLAEFDKGIRDVLCLREVFLSKPAVFRAYDRTLGVKNATAKLEDRADYVEEVRFRSLLLYLRLYFKLFVMFKTMDANGDRRLSQAEFEDNLSHLENWGVKMTHEESQSVFQQILAEADARKDNQFQGRQILFEDFADWAISKQLDNFDFGEQSVMPEALTSTPKAQESATPVKGASKPRRMSSASSASSAAASAAAGGPAKSAHAVGDKNADASAPSSPLDRLSEAKARRHAEEKAKQEALLAKQQAANERAAALQAVRDQKKAQLDDLKAKNEDDKRRKDAEKTLGGKAQAAKKAADTARPASGKADGKKEKAPATAPAADTTSKSAAFTSGAEQQDSANGEVAGAPGTDSPSAAVAAAASADATAAAAESEAAPAAPESASAPEGASAEEASADSAVPPLNFD